jgi:NAD(P)-dependent dehydrogenase (short-subunit alcohol dehydrogenase family)
MKAGETAIVFGVGSGLGWALVKRLAADNMRVGAVARCAANLDTLTGKDPLPSVRSYSADVSQIHESTQSLTASRAIWATSIS